MIPGNITRHTFSLTTSFEKAYTPVATHATGHTTTSAGDNGVVTIYTKSLTQVDLLIMKTSSINMSSYIICVGS